MNVDSWTLIRSRKRLSAPHSMYLLQNSLRLLTYMNILPIHLSLPMYQWCKQFVGLRTCLNQHFKVGPFDQFQADFHNLPFLEYTKRMRANITPPAGHPSLFTMNDKHPPSSSVSQPPKTSAHPLSDPDSKLTDLVLLILTFDNSLSLKFKS